MTKLPGDEPGSPMWRLRPENQPYSAEREAEFKAKFPYLSMSPEEYVARNAHMILCFSLHRYILRDESLKAWLQRAYDLLRDWEQVKLLRRQYLTSQEIEEAERIENEI